MKPKAENQLSKMPKETGFTIPDGFFEEFEQKMEARIAEMPIATPPTVTVSLWQRMRPYVYMAAMFVGITLMLRMFNDFKGAVMPEESEAVLVRNEEDSLLDYIYCTSMDNQYAFYNCILSEDDSDDIDY